MGTVISANTLTKHSGESIIWGMDFAAWLETGETISSVDTVTVSPMGLTVGINVSPISGTKARIDVSSGVAGEEYNVTVTITTSLGNIRVGVGPVKVRDC